MPIAAEIKKSFSAARILGNGDDRVTLQGAKANIRIPRKS